jgi:2-octaprenyl-6-methoxyphenol hydroxylase
MNARTKTEAGLEGSDLEVDVVIVGAALSGLATATTLISAGLDVAVVDRFDPRDEAVAKADIRTTAISLASRRMLEVLGAWDEAAETAEPILDIRISDAGSRAHMHYDHAEVGDEPMGHIAENARLKQGLLRRLQQGPGRVVIIAPASVAGLSVSEGAASVTLDTGQVVTAPLAIAADGRNSTLRDLAHIRVSGLPYHQSSIVDTIEHERPHHNVAHERFLPGGPLALLPLPGNRSALVWTDKTEVAERLSTLDDAMFSAALRDRFGDSLGRLTPVGPRRVYPLSLSVAEKHIGDRVALVGDAGHAIHPIAGQGFNLGLRDVAALAEVLTDAARLGLDIGSASVLEEYQRRRRFDTMTMVAATDGLTRLFSNDFGPVRMIRDFGLGLTSRIGPFKRAAVRHAMGTLGTLPRLMRGEPL